MKITRRPKPLVTFSRLIWKVILSAAITLGMGKQIYFAIYRFVFWLSGLRRFQNWRYWRFADSFDVLLDAVRFEGDRDRELQKQIAIDVFSKTTLIL